MERPQEQVAPRSYEDRIAALSQAVFGPNVIVLPEKPAPPPVTEKAA